MDNFRIGRSPFSHFTSLGKQEPLIVVEESNVAEEEDKDSSGTNSKRGSLDIESPVNPYLLSPWRDQREGRKHSLPSQQVTEGITASQVRRLSERGGEGSGPTPREAAFLATISQAPAPSGRRHSVVTISKVPPTLFGRGRRESVAAIPSSNRVLGLRRESTTSIGPPSTDPIGSIHNLQLDIMDDIVQSRKARLKLWTTSSDKVSEVAPLHEVDTTPQRYTNRRYSECVTAERAPSPSIRRPSENPAVISPSVMLSNKANKKASGFLGSRGDLSSFLNTLTSSAIEIHRCADTPSTPQVIKSKTTSGPGNKLTIPSTSSSNLLDPNAGRSTRSNSFDVSILTNAKQIVSEAQDNSSAALSSWFAKRHEPMARKKSIRSKSTAVALSKEMIERLQQKDSLRESKPKLKPRSKQKSWTDHTKGAILDATSIGTVIEGFLRTAGPGSSTVSATTSSAPGMKGTAHKGAVPKDHGPSSRRNRTQNSAQNAVRSTLNWFSKGNNDNNTKDSCDSSLCSTLKDLFVK